MSLEHDNWKGTTGGMPWMQRTLICWLSVVDQRVIYAIMSVVILFYMLFGHAGYITMYHFYRRCRKESWYRAFGHVYMNHYRFGQVVIDRFAACGGKKYQFVFDEACRNEYLALGKKEEGFVQLSCHMGNYELAGYSMRQERKKMYPLVFMGETETMMLNRQKMFRENGIEMVPVAQDMSHVFALNNALRDGHIASMPGDRVFGSTKSLPCAFMGGTADLPVGPFQMAVTRDLPVVPVFVMKENWNTYRVFSYILMPDNDLPKPLRMQRLAQQFADLMSAMVDRYPTQWFNYFDFVRY